MNTPPPNVKLLANAFFLVPRNTTYRKYRRTCMGQWKLVLWLMVVGKLEAMAICILRCLVVESSLVFIHKSFYILELEKRYCCTCVKHHRNENALLLDHTCFMNWQGQAQVWYLIFYSRGISNHSNYPLSKRY